MDRVLRETRAGYDKIAPAYAECCFQDPHEKTPDHYVLDVVLEHTTGTLCDMGCGPGHLLRYLYDSGVRALVGVDLSAGMLAQARGRNPEVELVQASMHDLPVQDGAWGTIVAFYSLIHVRRRDVLGVLREFERVLAPGGLLLVAFHLGLRTIRAKQWGAIPVKLTYTYFRLTEMERSLRMVGFEVQGAVSAKDHQGRPTQGYVFARKPRESR